MSKQDRQGARTAADIERKYNFGKSFAEVMGVAEKAVETAKNEASNLNEKLTSEEIFNRLTNNGQLQGLYRGDDGELYINASFLATGVISSADGTIKLDIGNNKVTIDGTRNGYKTQVVLSSSGIEGYGESTSGVMEKVLSILIGVGGLPSGVYNEAWQESAGLLLGCMSGVLSLGESSAPTEITGSYVDINNEMEDVRILGKTVYWKSNGDGTYSLAARD